MEECIGEQHFQRNLVFSHGNFEAKQFRRSKLSSDGQSRAPKSRCGYICWEEAP